MRIGLFSDVHGNQYAFQVVWEALKNEGCDIYCFMGDICGYYYGQKEIIDMLSSIKNVYCIKGNHDQMFLNMLDNLILEEEYTKRYGRSYVILKEKIEVSEINFLKALPDHLILNNGQIAMFHGSPWNFTNEYIYPDQDMERFQAVPYKYVFLGHTHHPLDVQLNSIRVINPGSCGQPRDFCEPSYGVLDLEQNDYKVKRIQYDSTCLKIDIKNFNEINPYLIDVLNRGRKIK